MDCNLLFLFAAESEYELFTTYKLKYMWKAKAIVNLRHVVQILCLALYRHVCSL